MNNLTIINEPDPNSPTWPVVLAFAKIMEHKLAQNRHKGGRDGWLTDGVHELKGRIYDEYVELDDALLTKPMMALDVALEAADIANMAMMTADRATNGHLLNALMPPVPQMP